MKSRTYTLKINTLCGIILLLLSTIRTSACGPFIWFAQDYNIPRIYDENSYTTKRASLNALYADWKAMTGVLWVSEKDIKEVVNKFSANDVREIMRVDKPSNSFAAWINKHKRSDIIDYLVIAKECERVRALHRSRWYYPSKEDSVEMTLEDIRDVCTQRAHWRGQLSSRYTLQAMRAMISLGDYDGMETLWAELGSSIPKGVIRDMCLGYFTRALFEHGHEDEAIEMYSKAGDLHSLDFCLKRIGRPANRFDMLEYVAKYCPNNDYAPKTLQEWFSMQVREGFRWNEKTQAFDDRNMIGREWADRICRICDMAVNNSECSNPSMWLYCKSLALEFNDRPLEALAVNRQAARAHGTDFIQNSIRVLGIWLDARTSTYDKGYEQRLFKDLQWLDRMIVNNLTEDVRSTTIEHMWKLSINQSYYYWNDMLRKIVIGEVCPKLIDMGQDVLAIRLANMADYRLLGIVGSDYRNKEYNEYDYCNNLFELLNHKVKIESIEKYISSMDKPSNAFESFLDSRGYKDKAYFLDIAGTRYIRDFEYAKAVHLLEQVPSAYQYRLNTVEYMNRDPWQVERNKQSFIFADYKLNFAKKMAEYDRIICGSFGADEKGRAKIRKGIGMRAAASFAWPLTEYFCSSYPFETDNYSKADALAESLIRQGLAQILDKEVKAQELLNLQLRLEVVKNYNGTLACRDILRHCDEYADYR